MLTLAVTLLAAAYFYGPGILYRFVLSKALGKDNALQTATTTQQQVTEALLWLPPAGCAAAVWIAVSHVFANSDLAGVAGTLVDWLNGRSPYAAGSVYLDACLQAFLWQNLQLLGCIYICVGLLSGVIFAILRGARRLQNVRAGRLLVSAALQVTPSISEWYVQLQGMFVANGAEIHVDVLTKTGGLYRGELGDFFLESSGTIRTLTLNQPARFDRGRLEERRKTHPYVRSELFWRSIPGNNFVLTGADIVNVNVRYVLPEMIPAQAVHTPDAQLLLNILSNVQRQKNGPTP